MADHDAPSLGLYRGVPLEDESQLHSSLAPGGAGAPNQDLERNDTTNEDDNAIDGEDAGFLPMEYEGEIGTNNSQKLDKATLRKVLTMSIIFLFIVELGSYIMEPPLQEILEDFICHKSYPDHKTGIWSEQDKRCKEAGVEGTLAIARSWMMWAKMVVPLFVQIPYGMMADKYGRRPVLFLALLGSLLATAWNFIVLMQPDAFSVWQLPLGYVATLLGGGDSVTIAMVWTILTDVVPADARTNLFYKLHAMMLIMSAATRPIAGWLMSQDPWLPMWIGLLAIGLSTISTLFIPETLHLSQTMHHKTPYTSFGSENPDNLRLTTRSLVSKGVSLARVELLRIWHFIFSSRKVMLLIISYGLSNPIFMAFEMNMLQYITVRFGWDWSTATYYSIISKLTSVIVLLGILPFASRAVEDRYRGNVISRDLSLALASIGFITSANMITVAAARPWLLVVALIVYGAGGGFWAQVRALLAETVARNSLATMSSVVAMVETLAGLTSIPLLGWLLSKGIQLGGFWIGLPYVLTSVCAAVAGVALLAFKRL